MKYSRILNKGFTKFIEEHFDMLTGATPKEQPKRANQSEQTSDNQRSNQKGSNILQNQK